jgi:hypothetical protein
MRRFVMMAACLALAGCAVRPPKPAEFPPVEPRGPLAGTVGAFLTVLNRDGRVPESGVLALELRLANLSNADAVVYNELASGWLVAIEIMSVDGRRYARSPRPKRIPADLAELHHYATLPPGGFVGRRYAIRPTDLSWKLRPGTYRVRVVYRNRYEWCVANPAWSEDDRKRLGARALVPLTTGLIASNIEEFTVVATSAD